MAAMSRPSSSVVQPYMFEPESDPEEGGEAPAEPQTQRIKQDASEWSRNAFLFVLELS